MNTAMWNHPITETHIDTLREFGYDVIDPVAKTLACGDVGIGAMASVDDIATHTIARGREFLRQGKADHDRSPAVHATTMGNIIDALFTCAGVAAIAIGTTRLAWRLRSI